MTALSYPIWLGGSKEFRFLRRLKRVGMRFLGILVLATASPSFAVTVSQSATASQASDQRCAITRPAAAFQQTDAQVFFWFLASNVRAGERLTVEWVNPQGTVATTAAYEQLPMAPSLCFLTQLPLAGFEAASLPGTWSVRVISNGRALVQRAFTIAGVAGAAFQPRAITRSGTALIVEGSGVEAAARGHLAVFTTTGGWQYIAELFPTASEPNRLTLGFEGEWKTGEYLVVLRAADGRTSQPARFQISSEKSYRIPVLAGETWVVSQGPHGSTHFGNTSQAYDLAPIQGRCIVAMRPGVAHSFDKGERQCFGCRSYGNYITIDHEDGEYSHYGHLKAGTFLVRSGQRVSQGQPLAIVGNSGYTLGPGGGYHLHVQVTRAFPIASNSVPFRFAEFSGRARGTFVSANGTAGADCSRGQGNPVIVPTSSRGLPLNGPRLNGSVAVAEWWNGELAVPAGTRQLDLRLAWEGAGREMDLHLVSPSGKHYGWYGQTDGYSGQASNPEEYHIANPEQGRWRVSVQGTRGTGEQMGFQIESGLSRMVAGLRN